MFSTFKTYIKPIFDYACTLCDCTNANVEKIQGIHNIAARIICAIFDITTSRGIHIVKQLNWQTLSQRIDLFFVNANV